MEGLRVPGRSEIRVNNSTEILQDMEGGTMTRLIIALTLFVALVAAAVFLLIIFLGLALLLYGRKPKEEKAPAET